MSSYYFTFVFFDTAYDDEHVQVSAQICNSFLDTHVSLAPTQWVPMYVWDNRCAPQDNLVHRRITFVNRRITVVHRSG